MITLAGIQFRDAEIEKLFFTEDKKFLVTYKTIYQICYSKNSGWHTLKLYTKNGKLPLLQKGRFMITKADVVNSLAGSKLVVD